MPRIITLIAAIAFLLGLGAPAVLAADPVTRTGPVLVAINRTVDIAPGDHLDALVVIGGTATIRGDVTSVFVLGGTATLTGATAGNLLVVNGSADVVGGSIVRGDVRTLNATVTRTSDAVIAGSVGGLDGDLSALGLLLFPALILLLVGLAIAFAVLALLVVALGARQVRTVETLISRQPGQVLVAGIVGTIAVPLLALLLMATLIGAPVGLAVLLGLPVAALLGWIVAAVWIGDRIVERLRGGEEPERPYLAAVVGVVVLAVAGSIPPVGLIATLFGFGGIALAAWRTLRHEPVLPGEPGQPGGAGAPAAAQPGAAQPAPTAS